MICIGEFKNGARLNMHRIEEVCRFSTAIQYQYQEHHSHFDLAWFKLSRFYSINNAFDILRPVYDNTHYVPHYEFCTR